MKLCVEITIQSPPDVVFGWIKDPQKARVWPTGVAGGEIIHNDPQVVGTTFRETVADENGSVELNGVITGFEPNRLITFHLDSRVNTVEVSYRVEATPSGARLVQEAEVRWKFPVNIICLFQGVKIRQGILRQTQAELNRLKELCEHADRMTL